MKSHQTGVGDLATADIKTAPPTAHAGENHNALGELIGSFDAAISEGLFAALAETTDERLKDLVERRACSLDTEPLLVPTAQPFRSPRLSRRRDRKNGVASPPTSGARQSPI